MPQPIVIFTPMHLEAQAIRRGLRSIGDSTTPIHVIGIGARHLPVPALLPVGSSIILTRFAGGINPSLNVGDLVLDDGAACLALPAASPHGSRLKQGKIIGRAALVASASEKAAIFAQTAADAVDMETHLVHDFASPSSDSAGYRTLAPYPDQAPMKILTGA